jgi:hypothetical protein
MTQVLSGYIQHRVNYKHCERVQIRKRKEQKRPSNYVAILGIILI